MTNKEPFSILCFGDGNTWGVNPSTGRRLGRNERWPGRLQESLGSAYHIIEDGLPGRTTTFDDPLGEDVNGAKHLPLALSVHRPLDMVILMLGSSDLAERFHASATTIVSGLDRLTKIALASEAWRGAGSPQVLIVSPPSGPPERSQHDSTVDEAKKPGALSSRIAGVASTLGCLFLDADPIARVGEDGVHLALDGHVGIGKAIHAVALETLEPRP